MIYAKVGEGVQQVGGSMPAETGWVEMQSQRPTESGTWLAQADGTWVRSGTELDDAKKAKVQEINRGYASRVSAVKADTVQEEVDTWDIQRLEAMAWEIDNTASTPQLDIVALNRGIPREEMIQRTLTKTKAFEQYVFTLLGTKQKYEDVIEAATTVEEVNAITWE